MANKLAEEIQQINNWFSYHKPEGDQAERYEQLRAAGGALGRVIAALCPESHDRDVAIDHVRSAIHWANASIACQEK